jgi:hypothetical protein
MHPLRLVRTAISATNAPGGGHGRIDVRGHRRYRHVVPSDPGDPLAPFLRDPAMAGIFSDFDGTLSPIVADPALAEPLAGVPELLGELARRYQVVAVVSGRPVAFLAARLPASILLAGL